MKSIRYKAEFKVEAIKQICSVAELVFDKEDFDTIYATEQGVQA